MGQYAEQRLFFNAEKSKVMVVGTSSGESCWKIDDEEMEEVRVFSLIGVCEAMCSWRKWQKRPMNT